GAGKTFQNDAESSRRDVKAARLEPDAFCIRNPEAVVLQVDVSNEVFAAPLSRIEAVGETAEGSDWHMSSYCASASVVSRSARIIFSRVSRALAKMMQVWPANWN